MGPKRWALVDSQVIVLDISVLVLSQQHLLSLYGYMLCIILVLKSKDQT